MKADSTIQDCRAGCRVCDPPGVWRWDKRNALAVAARHHQATGHETWAEMRLTARWGGEHRAQLDQLAFDLLPV